MFVFLIFLRPMSMGSDLNSFEREPRQFSLDAHDRCARRQDEGFVSAMEDECDWQERAGARAAPGSQPPKNQGGARLTLPVERRCSSDVSNSLANDAYR
jgi:hypothetical protein